MTPDPQAVARREPSIMEIIAVGSVALTCALPASAGKTPAMPVPPALWQATHFCE